MDQLPIDVQSAKLTDWLVSRRVCDRHWVRDAAEARRRIAQLAASDSLNREGVSPELQAALRQPQIHYWHCERITDALKRLDAANKSILFGYSSAVIRELDAILKLYKRGGCYLADAARLLMKLAQEEAPLIKRQTERSRRRQAECERLRGELAASGAEARSKFSALCRQFGLACAADPEPSVDQATRQLVAQADALPAWFDSECMPLVRGLADAARLYKGFTGVHGEGEGEGEACPTLNYLVRRGNTTVYEFRRGRSPVGVELPTPRADKSETPGGDGEGEGGIDFGDEIDFSAVADADSGDGVGGIDFDIEEITEVAGGDAAAEGPASEPAENDDGIARGEQARSVLDTLDLRERLLDDLHELDTFYARLSAELGDHGNCVAQLVLSGSPEATAAAAVAAAAGAGVRGLIAHLTEPGRAHLMLTRSAPAYLGRLTRRFAALADQAEKSAAASRLLDRRRQEAEEEERQLGQQLTALRAQIRELKVTVEAEISRRCDNRRVNIMGEVNAV